MSIEIISLILAIVGVFLSALSFNKLRFSIFYGIVLLAQFINRSTKIENNKFKNNVLKKKEF